VKKKFFFLGGYLCVKKGCKKVICTGNVLKKGANFIFVKTIKINENV